MFVYPASLLRKVAWRLPLVLWRTGLAPAFSILPMVVITTRRRKTGQPRTVTTDYTSFDGKIYVVPGWGERNQWYRNIEPILGSRFKSPDVPGGDGASGD